MADAPNAPSNPTGSPSGSRPDDPFLPDQHAADATYRLADQGARTSPDAAPFLTAAALESQGDSSAGSLARQRRSSGSHHHRSSHRSQRALPDTWSGRFFDQFLILTLSFCVMSLELVAARLVGKHLGNSLHTWTAVIGVILAGISVGNLLGGWLADQPGRQRRLGWVVLLASVCCVACLLLDRTVLERSRPSSIDWPWWVALNVGLLFFAPAVMLGAASPMIAAMTMERSGHSGRTLGEIYALGSIGAIAGTFVTGFYLIEILGTRTILGVIAAVLGMLAALISPRKAFRASVIVGWLQFSLMVTLLATARGETLAWAGQWMAETWNWRMLSSQQTSPVAESTEFARDVGSKLHELGLLAGLRDDDPAGFQLDSQYSLIRVEDQWMDNERVKVLRLDHLIHSYWNPAQPHKLYYDYEQIYAAVTESLFSAERQTVTLPLEPFPGWEQMESRLPVGVTFDAARNELTISDSYRGTPEDLLKLADDSEFFVAVDELARLTSVPAWGGFSTVPLNRLPGTRSSTVHPNEPSAVHSDVSPVGPQDSTESPAAPREIASALEVENAATVPVERSPTETELPGTTLDSRVDDAAAGFLTNNEETALDEPAPQWPAELINVVRFEERLGVLMAYSVLTPEHVDQLYGLSPVAPWARAVRGWRAQSRALRTFFVGGGGFVFPRWIEHQFPGSSVIDVAELDPAVIRVAQTELGLKPFGESRVRPQVGDARVLLREQLEHPEHRPYDAIYGDAFSDLSIPWHLTTREFALLVKRALAPDGAYLLNVIDIFPRHSLPGGTVGRGETAYKGTLPDGIASAVDHLPPQRWVAAPGGYEGLRVLRVNGSEYRLAVNSGTTAANLDRYRNAAPRDFGWQRAIDRLAQQVQAALPYRGEVPNWLAANDARSASTQWQPAAAPWPWLESRTQDGATYLSIRGRPSSADVERLAAELATNAEWGPAVRDAGLRSQAPTAGRFLGRLVATLASVFDSVTVFSTEGPAPSDSRDTFVIVAHDGPNRVQDLPTNEHWTLPPFAWLSRTAPDSAPELGGQMPALLPLADDLLLTDDFAPVDHLLLPVIRERE